jgi:hypothetical protein
MLLGATLAVINLAGMTTVAFAQPERTTPSTKR